MKRKQGQNAIKLFQHVQQKIMWPNFVTFVRLLNVCANMIMLEDNRCVHQQIIESDCKFDVFVGKKLVDMDAKCGNMEDV
jgi:hypothetical protein